MTEFTPVSALIGGTLIGLGATMLMWFLGRIAGISGIVSGAAFPQSFSDWSWRAAFLIGMIVAPSLYAVFMGHLPDVTLSSDLLKTVVAGLIVGVGVTFGAGCASGHGVCGIARVSPRSIVATATFMAVALVTVFVTRHVVGA
ncbi:MULTISPECIES: YeeE/YedE family protein [Filomicrobium]|uniref:Sulphur transport domain-containing protein n=1 Tax=Filomicrobium insigne TaxID=418854 RepID=A0A1H0GXN4_9HYPH|nr:MULTISPECIES: YeeE/YedE family protein [Filomicrobium]MCV0370270.1 YeeE/YedE family protein [Filomicrobium sp.]SDO11562.1 hypothetical protein SAMN04488061_0306 [Filomicrobium insigne]